MFYIVTEISLEYDGYSYIIYALIIDAPQTAGAFVVNIKVYDTPPGTIGRPADKLNVAVK